MLSRRSIRIKVLHQLYALQQDSQLTSAEASKNLNKAIQESYELCTFTLFVLTELSELAQQDASRRVKKHIKTDFDLAFSAKLSDNPLLDSLLRDEQFLEALRKYRFKEVMDTDFLRKIYSEFIQTEDFKTYLSKDADDLESHRAVMLDLFRFFRNHDLFKEVASFRYSGWAEDRSLFVGMVKKLIKLMPYEGGYIDHIQPVDEDVEDFGRALLQATMKHKEEFVGWINPTLENWDMERLAVLDTIMLQMALAEFLYFPTIPKKVTLNEYLDLSKMYSTAKSKEFINGVLDRLMGRLVEEGLIVKEGRGLVDD